MANYGLNAARNDEKIAPPVGDDNKAYTPKHGPSRSPRCRGRKIIRYRTEFADNGQNARAFNDYRWRRSELLVSPRYELSRADQYVGVLWLRWSSGGGWAHYVGREKIRARKPAGSRWRLP